MDTNELIARIRAVASAEDMSQVRQLIEQLPGKMPPEIQNALQEKLAEITQQSKAERQAIVNTLKLHGVEYPLTEWLTLKNYAEKFGISNKSTISNWITRGIIPPENIKDIPELDLRLIKAVEYQPRPVGRPEKLAEE